MFYDILEQKTPFYAIKSKTSKSKKIDIFPNWLVHDLGPKLAIFPSFFISNIKARKMCFMIFYNENTSF